MAELLELGSAPIRPDAPAGGPGRDEPEFEALQLELRKLEMPDQPTVRWDAAIAAATTLLSSKSKDLLVAAYLTVALFERDGYPGLVTGLTILRDMVTTYWEPLFPEIKRLRGRSAAFEWLSERGAGMVRKRGEDGIKADAVKAALERIEQIGAALDDKLENGAGLLGDLRDSLDELPLEESPPPAAAPSASAPSPGPATASPSVSASSVPTTLTSEDDLQKVLGEAKRLLRTAADYVRTQEPTSALAYRIPRFAAWLTVKQLPPEAGGKTQIPAPQPADLIDKLNGMLAAGQYAGVLQETEGRIGNAVFWLDLHRLAAQALDKMGPDAKPAADAVRSELASLLRRLPRLPELRFVNDQPLASRETREWIESSVLAGDGGGGVSRVSRASDAEGEDEGDTKLLEEAWGLARQKDLPAALGMLERAAQSGRVRERARWKLEMARMCMESGYHDTALAQLEGLDQEMRSASVEEWDPEISVEVLRGLLQARQRNAAKTPDDAIRARELMGRLCRLDVVAALELNGKK